MRLFNENPIDWHAYAEGKQACKDSEDFGLDFLNPYTTDTDQWFSWNRGWNAY